MSDDLTQADFERIGDYIVARIQKPEPAMISAQPGSVTCFCGYTVKINAELISDHGYFADWKCKCGRIWKIFYTNPEEG